MVAVGSASPTSVNFGDQTVGTSSQPVNVTLQNTGADDLVISSIATTGDYSQTNTCPINPQQLAPSQSCSIAVTFTPTRKGIRKGRLIVTHDGYKGRTTVTLTGTGD